MTGCALATIQALSAKERLLLEHDPHGLILATTSILFVFAVLFILYCIYGLSGEYFKSRQRSKIAGNGYGDADNGNAVIGSAADTGRAFKAGGASVSVSQVAAESTDDEDLAVVIATALELYRQEQALKALQDTHNHDIESGIITIRRDEHTNWTRI